MLQDAASSDVDPSELKSVCWTDICSPTIAEVSSMTTRPGTNPHTYGWVDKQILKIWSIHIIEYNAGIKRVKSWAMWMKSENTVLRKISQGQKDKHHMGSPLCENKKSVPEEV